MLIGRLLAACWIVSCIASSDGLAQSWDALSTATIDTRTAEHRIKLPDNVKRTTAIRLEGAERDVAIESVDLIYASGRADYVGGPIALRPAMPSEPLIARDTGLVLDEIVLRLRADRLGGRTRLVISGLMQRVGQDTAVELPSPRGQATQKYVEVGVHYATTRVRQTDRTKDGQPLVSFGGAKADATTLGHAIVTVPTEGRVPGSIPRPPFDFVLRFRREDPAKEWLPDVSSG